MVSVIQPLNNKARPGRSSISDSIFTGKFWPTFTAGSWHSQCSWDRFSPLLTSHGICTVSSPGHLVLTCIPQWSMESSLLTAPPENTMFWPASPNRWGILMAPIPTRGHLALTSISWWVKASSCLPPRPEDTRHWPASPGGSRHPQSSHPHRRTLGTA